MKSGRGKPRADVGRVPLPGRKLVTFPVFVRPAFSVRRVSVGMRLGENRNICFPELLQFLEVRKERIDTVRLNGRCLQRSPLRKKESHSTRMTVTSSAPSSSRLTMQVAEDKDDQDVVSPSSRRTTGHRHCHRFVNRSDQKNERGCSSLKVGDKLIEHVLPHYNSS